MNPLDGWGDETARRLLDPGSCPVCGRGRLSTGVCQSCGADLRGPLGSEIWAQTVVIAEGLRARDALLRQVPTAMDAAPAAASPGAVAPPAMTSAPAVAPPTTPSPPAAASGAGGHLIPTPPRSSATLQSVLAVAGAGLFAIAALIFTFLNPDLTDTVLRSAIVAGVTVVFVGGAWLLARRGLQFSAEAVGALGMVFLALDVYAIAQLGATPSAEWVIAASATAIAGTASVLVSRPSRIRMWGWAGTVGIAVVPAMIGYAVPGEYPAALGHVATAFLAVALRRWMPRHTPPVPMLLLQLAAVVSALVIALVAVSGMPEPWLPHLAFGGMLLLIAAHAYVATTTLGAGWWSVVLGAASASGAAFLVFTAVAPFDEGGMFLPVAAVVAALAFALVATMPLPAGARRAAVAVGGLFFPALFLLPLLLNAASIGMGLLFDVLDGRSEPWPPYAVEIAMVLALAGVAAALALFGVLARRRGLLGRLDDVLDPIAVVLGILSLLALSAILAVPMPVAVGIVLVVTAGIALVASSVAARPGVRVAVVVGIHLALVVAVVLSWRDPTLAPAVGIAILAVLVLAARTVPAGARFVHVGVGFAYALVCLATALAHTPLGAIAVLSLTTTAGLIGAMAVTFIDRVPARDWYAVLIVAAVPFVLGVAQVVVERSGWTALSAAVMFALALTLLLTRRPGLSGGIRTLAAGMLVPTVAVLIVCLGAQLLAVSGSPVTLPIIAAVVAFVLPSTGMIRAGLIARGRGEATATAARVAIEASALLTAVIAVGLALAREAAGLGTAFLVLVIIGIGAVGGALFAGRRYLWWVAGASFTGALWSVWAIIGVDLLEAYVLPPALAAVIVAVVLAARRQRARGLFAAGLGVAIAPTLLTLVLTGARGIDGPVVPWRALALLAAAVVLIVVARVFTARAGEQLRALAVPAHLAALLAAAAGVVQGIRFGARIDLVPAHGLALFALCLGCGAVAAALMGVAGHGIRSAVPRPRVARWAQAPAVLALAAATWTAIERDWGSIWAMWGLMLALLVAVVVAAARAPRSALPPVWFLFGLAFITAIIAWSPRDLRVETFSLPLGIFLLAAGVIGMRRGAASGGSLDSWPIGHAGSWRLLAPGLVVLLSASITATFTDPLTWRAILVMALALAAILLGASRRLAAPFLIGMVVLPIENVVVFAVQIGRGIASMPWWITLAVVGAVLLIIAVTYERRTGAEDSVAARIRDLR